MLTKIKVHLHKFKNPWKPVEQIDQINAKSQKRKYPEITADKTFMESGACPPFIKPSKQDEDRDCDLISILSSRYFTFQCHLTSLYMIPTKYKFQQK